MADRWLALAGQPLTRRLVESLGLPLPLPERLDRPEGPWPPRVLEDRELVVGELPPLEGAGVGVWAPRLAALGATCRVAAAPAVVEIFRQAGKGHGRKASALEPSGLADGARVEGLLFDARAATTVEDLDRLRTFFGPLLPNLARSGRCVVVGRSTDLPPGEAAVQGALEGFVRSLAKEVGRRGATANLLRVEPGAEREAEGPLAFLLSNRSAFVSGQPLRVRSGVGPGTPPAVRSLEGKHAVVTGAARGIGEATARRLAGEGARVLCVDRPEDGAAASALARSIGGAALALDVTAADAPERLAERLLAFGGGVDVVVHNAGVTRDRTLARMDAERWRTALEVNLGAVLRMHAALSATVLRDHGRVICLSSVAGIAGNVGQTNYAASKAGLIAFVRAEAAVLAERGITVNAVAPGFIETRLTEAIPFAIREAGRRLAALGQGGRPEDVAETITFLATPFASGLNGSVLRVCGGALIGA